MSTRPVTKAVAASATAAPAVAVNARGGIGLSMRRMGAVGARPAAVEDVIGASGSWIVTALTASAGMVIGCLHFGQGPVRPANWSLTANRDLQLGQMTGMDMLDSGRRRTNRVGGGSFRRGRGCVKGRGHGYTGADPPRPLVGTGCTVAFGTQTSMDDDKTRILGADEATTRILPGAAVQPPRELPEPRVDNGRIIFHCSAGHRLIVPQSQAGKRGKCSKCGVSLQIPDLAAVAAVAAVAAPAAPEPVAEPESPPALPAFEAAAEPPPQAAPPAAVSEAADEGEWNFISGIDHPAQPAVDAGAAFDEPGWSHPAPGAGPGGGDGGNPMARLLARLWTEREHGGIVEIHLTGGSVILPEEFAARWSGGSHGLFASQAADGTVTLTAVAWETVQRIVVRHLSAVPGDMFE